MKPELRMYGGTAAPTITPCIHFCWIGPRLPWVYAFAVLSAARNGGIADVVLHHVDALEDDAVTRAIATEPGVRLQRLEPNRLLANSAAVLGIGSELQACYERLTQPAAKADLLRAAILYLDGGIYLDLDTVTVASLQPLLGPEPFVGSEYIVWPAAVRRSRAPLRWLRALTLDLVRKALRRTPAGWRWFRHVERWYFCGVNNAVMGAPPASPLFAAYLRQIAAMPAETQRIPYAIGPDLLQGLVDDGRHRCRIEPPTVFYPLPPEISEHWFRPRRGVARVTATSAATRVVHWYASVRTKGRIAGISPASIHAQRERQLYSALVHDHVRPLPDEAVDFMAEVKKRAR